MSLNDPTASSLPTTSPSHIWLVGMMASGKSSVGKALADRLGMKFVDTDDALVQSSCMSIYDIFSAVGETVFRLMEHELVKELTQKEENMIISTGGGTPCFYDNMERMNQSGETVFLDIPSSLLAQRTVEHEKTGKPIRPLLHTKSIEERVAIFERLSEERGPVYRQAKIHMVIEGSTFEDAVSRLLALDVCKR